MEALGAGIGALAGAICSAVGWLGIAAAIGIGCLTFLLYTKTITLNEIKDFIKKDRWSR